MTKTCIAYATHEGQTAKIAEYIADVIRAHGQKAEILDLRTSGHTAPSEYDAVGSRYLGDRSWNAVKKVLVRSSPLRCGLLVTWSQPASSVATANTPAASFQHTDPIFVLPA